MISSFNPLCLFRLAAAAPSLRRGFLIDPDKPWGPQAYVLSPLVSSHSVHPLPRGVHAGARGGVDRAGLRVAAWTVDDPARARELEELGVSYLITNRPGLLREALRGEAA